MSDKKAFRELFPNAMPFNVYCHDCDWKWRDNANISQARKAVLLHTKTTGHTAAFHEAINLNLTRTTTKPQTRNQLSLFC